MDVGDEILKFRYSKKVDGTYLNLPISREIQNRDKQ